MSYSEIRKAIEDDGYEETFVNLFNDLFKALNRYEIASQQLKYEKGILDQLSSDCENYLKILHKDEKILPLEGSLIASMFVDGRVDKMILHPNPNRIEIKSEPLTFTTAPNCK